MRPGRRRPRANRATPRALLGLPPPHHDRGRSLGVALRRTAGARPRLPASTAPITPTAPTSARA
eukprot:9214584-Alexandrium_andersonii.AAC.1